ncbi:enoyl-CoA hydratase [Paraburkholderia sp. A3BS-1L]|uniref:enoyl-CoA hydratase n=1 Tax=Paraburkholderia sp. A3BS-1L TaxID=3028375 RepID=UPI003DA9EF37
MKFWDAMEVTGRFAGGKLLAGKLGSVGIMLFNHPEKHNAVTLDMWSGIVSALTVLERDSTVRVVVYAGTGGKAFVSGADISQFESKLNDSASSEHYTSVTTNARTRLASFTKPSIACLQGYCLGGGLAIAMEADLRVASADALLGVTAARLGIAYNAHSVQRLVQLIGPSRTRLLLYTARRFTAQEAFDMGLVDVLVQDPIEETLTLARGIAANAPLSVLARKFAIAQSLKTAESQDWEGIEAYNRLCLESADYREGRRAFVEKREPVFAGR